MVCMLRKGWADSPDHQTLKAYCHKDFSACVSYLSVKPIDDVFLESLLKKDKKRGVRLKQCCADFFEKPQIFEKDLLEFFKICKNRYDKDGFCIKGDPINRFNRSMGLLLQEYLAGKGLIDEVYFFF